MKIYTIFIFFLYINSIVSSCSPNLNHCMKCNQLTDLCAICEKQEIFIPDNKGGCKGLKKCKLGRNYCNECDFEGNLCTKCEDGFYPDENGGCSLATNCKISYKGQCLECKDNYIILGTDSKYKLCKSILSNDYLNCKEIDYTNGECKICEENYFLNEGDKRCIKTEKCYESVYGNCISCIHGYYLNKKENKCIKKDDKFENCKETLDGENCEICNLDYYFDDNGICSYSNYCSEYKNKKCAKCKNGYFLTKDNSCSSSENCFYADKDTGLCITCNSNYYLDTKDYKCKSNLENNEFKYCMQVINNKCTNCEYKYRLGDDKKCSSTINCAEAENGKCIKCLDNYYLSKDNFCTSIEHCIYTYFYECIECDDNFYYNKYNIKCMEDKGIFKNCKISTNDGEFCYECKDNYYLNLTDRLCYENITNDYF